MRNIIFAVLALALLFTASCDDKKVGLEDKLVGAINAEKIEDVKIELSEETFKKSSGKYASYEAFVEERLNNNMDKLGRTPLVWASMMNMSTLKRTKENEKTRLEIVKYLLEKGADCNIKDKNGWTPLFWASWAGMDKIGTLLIEKCTNVNDKTDKDWTPLMAASMKGWHNVVALLLAKGADKNLKNNEGHTALDLTKHNFKVYPEFSVRLKKTIDLLEKGVGIPVEVKEEAVKVKEEAAIDEKNPVEKNAVEEAAAEKAAKEEVKKEIKEEVKKEVKVETKVEAKIEAKKEAKAEPKEEAKKPETKKEVPASPEKK